MRERRPIVATWTKGPKWGLGVVPPIGQQCRKIRDDWEEPRMLRLKMTRARFAAGLVAATALALLPSIASSQSKEPIKIGFGMALTGPLAANGKQALLGMKIWEEETNAAGGLLGRPVKLVFYDDQSNPSTVPGIYTKLLDADKVDLVMGPYATNMIAPAMPVVMQKGKTFITLFGLD